MVQALDWKGMFGRKSDRDAIVYETVLLFLLLSYEVEESSSISPLFMVQGPAVMMMINMLTA